ncbi:MAG: ABC transporter ATP-binding protein [Thermodesulfobacteriota bacterium]|nr:ABC transporter ATP-binding protein [Thermodesulfobacteriota bacterium]
MPGDPLLRIEDLHTRFLTSRGDLHALTGVDLDLSKGDTLGIVGESGCGKSVLALSILGLVPSPGRIERGRIFFEGTDLLGLSQDGLRRIRGGRISMIFQEPVTSLNPVYTIGDQIAEVIRLHQGDQVKTRSMARSMAAHMLEKVGISNARVRLKDYPHQLSGGMCQRVMIAMALACRPRLMIADEPTTALDVTTQAQILSLMNGLKEQTGTSIILVTHDLGIVEGFCQNCAVMYAGTIVESAGVEDFFADPLHPYTRGLLRAVPDVASRGQRLYSIPGQVPSLWETPQGCSFFDRCEERMDICRKQRPPIVKKGNNHMVRCWRYAT